MPDQSNDRVISQRHKRTFLQPGGPRPNKPVRYAGQDAQAVAITGVSAPETGGFDPIWEHDPRRVGQYRLRGRMINTPDLAKATFTFHEDHGSIPRQLARVNCFNAYVATGPCGDLSNFSNGWSDYVEIYQRAKVSNKDLGDRTSFDSDDATADGLETTLDDWYVIGPLSFGADASAEVTREVIDSVYVGQVTCNLCDDPDDAIKRIYSVCKSSGAASPGVVGEVIYTVDGGFNWAKSAITGIGASADPTAIDVVDDKLVVIVSSENAYYFSTINANTGVPGTWTKVTSGFVSLKTPNDLFVLSSREVFFAAEGGYLYKSTDITSGVTVLNAGSATTSDLDRINGYEDTLVATGESGTIVKSTNRGVTWSTTISTPTNATIRAVSVLDLTSYWIGTSGGKVYYTITGGETWVEQTFSGNAVIHDIQFATPDVGYIVAADSTPVGRIITTWNGGADWSLTTPSLLTHRVVSLPTMNRINRIAYPIGVDSTTAANNVALSCLAGDGTDGLILVGVANKL